MRYFQCCVTANILKLKKSPTFLPVNYPFTIETTDLKHTNSERKRAYEVSQSRMDPMRARLLEHLKKNAI